MRSILFFLLSLCYVIVSGQKVKVHIKGVVSAYKKLEFKDKAEKSKQLTIGTDVEIKTGVIAEDKLEIGLVAKTASILEVTKEALQLLVKNPCTSADCIGLKAAQYTIQAKGVSNEYTSMKCIKLGVTPDADFQLEHINATPEGSKLSKQFALDQASSDGTTKITVESGEIKQQMISLGFIPEKCTIAKTKTSAPIELIPQKTCTDVTKCMQLKATQYTIYADKVDKKQTKMKCEGNDIGEEDLFTLEHKSTYKDGSSVANKVEVSALGVIEGKPISLGFNPESCTIEEVVAPKEIKEKENCDAAKADCFENIVDDTKDPDSAFDNSYTLGLFTICVLLGNMF